jgi:hypothetical protein
VEIRDHNNGKAMCILLVPESKEEFDVLRAFMLAFEANPGGYIDVARHDEGLHIELIEPQ